MKQAAAFICRWNRLFRAALPALFCAEIFGIAACSLSGPPPAEYVLGALPAATATTVGQTGLPVLEVKRVQLPDYLDSTDILERRGNQLVPSSTSRWGERLSVGMTRALSASLAARLPRMVVTATPPIERPARQLLVDVAAFESREDRQIVLVARWTILDGTSRQILLTQETSLVEPVAGADDGAIVTAMSHALEELADQLAARIKSDCGMC
ncbi:membrane integrity-associated transporter subunit PqiC [Burkholderia ubonensis]|uniref:PqiC family protein n=1 Tax=Burkholderia ubonensis TaxID=101571 RepID=UPI0009B34FB7|nr:PqiC family protein [Burkholderia ubonensis]